MNVLDNKRNIKASYEESEHINYHCARTIVSMAILVRGATHCSVLHTHIPGPCHFNV